MKISNLKRTVSGLLCLFFGCGGLWWCTMGDFEASLERMPDYDYLPEIRELAAAGRLGEAEHLADWVLNGSSVENRDAISAVREEVHRKRTSLASRIYRAGKGFLVGDGASVEELGGAVVSDFLLWGDLRDLAIQGYNKARGRETDPVIAGLAAVGVVTSVAAYVPDPAEGVEVSADASISLLKTFRKTGHLSKKFGGVLVDGCRESVKAKSLTKGLKEIVVGMKGLFDGAGSARAAAVMKHVDDADALKAAAKIAKASPEPLAILVRAHGAKGIDAVRELAKAENGAETLAKAARKGPDGMKVLLKYPKYAARTAKAFRHEHPQRILKAVGRGPLSVLCGLLAAFGLFKLKIWKIREMFHKRNTSPA